MGNTSSNLFECESDEMWWTNGQCSNNVEAVSQNKNELGTKDAFSEDFERKRENRKTILEQKRKEIQNMREELQLLRVENQRLRTNSNSIQENPNNDRIEFLERQNQTLLDDIKGMNEREQQRECLLEKNKELRISISQMQSELQTLNSSVLDFEQEKKDYKRHVVALKDVIKVSKELLQIRENELIELKKKIQNIESEFNEREANLMSNDLRKEYERQLGNIRTLRELYEERSRTHRRETELLKSSITDKDREIEENVRTISELQERVQQLEKDDSYKYDTIKSLESNLGLAKAECRQFQAELTVINQLFSHILMAFNNSPDLDLDKLLKQLEAHHDLLKDIVSNEVSSEVSSALPKVLLDLVNQISLEPLDIQTDSDFENATETSTKESEELVPSTLHNLNSPAEIAENLPKVWKVLIELLSHQSANISSADICEEESENRCFKTIVTPKGPSLVLSVSKTFFRLKELIVEKKSLEKDMNNLKQLNTHLETRLQDQEKRFDVVSSELSKTWNFVSKLQKEHQLLHTQEQILRYELAQKRKLLKELKEELEYSREKWQQAREKNSKTEKEWLVLRKEFAARKKTIINLDENNSVESGYSDEKEESSDEEPGYETDISECNQKVDETGEDEAESDDVLLSENSTLIDHSNQNETTSEINSNHSTDLTLANNDENYILANENMNQSDVNAMQEKITEIASNSSCSNDDARLVTIVENIEVKSDNPEESSSRIQTRESSQTLEERLAARDERLSRLEGQCRALVSQVTNTSLRSSAICNKLEDLHEIYGETSRNLGTHSTPNLSDKTTEEMKIEGEDDHSESD